MVIATADASRRPDRFQLPVIASRVRPLSLWLPVAAMAAAIFAVSSIGQLPALPARVTDKMMHASVYTVFAATWLRALARGRWAGLTLRVAAVAVVAVTLYGVTDEFHQWFVPGRTADVHNLAADAFGATVAAGLGLAAGWLRGRGAARI